MRRIFPGFMILSLSVAAQAGGNGNNNPGANVWEQLAALQAQAM